jgi:hypothetical protein
MAVRPPLVGALVVAVGLSAGCTSTSSTTRALTTDGGGHATTMTSRPLFPSEVGRPIAELSTECARVS